MKKQHGFTLVEGLLIVLILCVVGFAGYYVMNNRDKKSDTSEQTTTQNSTSNQNETQQPAAAVKTKTFTNKDFGVTVDLPETWTTKDESSVENGVPFQFVVGISSGLGEASMFTVTGKGGDCQVKATDKPFAAGNGCPTLEYTRVTKTNDGGTLSRSSLSDSNGKLAYWLCYTPKNQTAPVANKPQMGFFLNCGANDIFIQIPNNTSDKAYDTEFVKQLESSLLTLSYSPKP